MTAKELHRLAFTIGNALACKSKRGLCVRCKSDLGKALGVIEMAVRTAESKKVRK
jgi:hypothetical protein